MLTYIIRRTLYSALIILGVIIVTFLLFRVAAGDPEATILGKKPAPEEIEDLRIELGSDKPIFWGYWRKTETYTACRFSKKSALPTINYSLKCKFSDGAIYLPAAEKVEFKRNFNNQGRIKLELQIKGNCLIDGQAFFAKDWKSVSCKLSEANNPEKLIVLGRENGVYVRNVQFYSRQKSPWDSQFIAALGEVIQFHAGFPFVSFLNFGKTLVTRENIRHVLWRGMWPSLFLMVPIFLGELFLGIVFAMISTVNRGALLDKGLLLLSIAGMSISYLVYIIFGQWYLGYYFNFFPVWGYGDVRHLFLPICIGILSGLGGGVRFYRTIFVNELNREYLRTARAKGCSSWDIYSKHLFKNALIPIITRASTIIPFLFTGSLLLERFFGIPGLGYAGIEALTNSDLQMVKALVILGAFIFVFINLITDIAYAWADPRIRLE